MSFNSPIPGSTTIIAKIEVRNNPDLPVVDMQHVEGGAHAVADLATRNAIPQSLRLANVTRCYVVATDTTYVLRGGTANTNWEPDGGDSTPSLEVGALMGTIQAVKATAIDVTIPNDLFKAVAPRTWSITSVQGLPVGLNYLSAGKKLVGQVADPGRFSVVINAQDSDGNRAQYVLPVTITATATDYLRNLTFDAPRLAAEGKVTARVEATKPVLFILRGTAPNTYSSDYRFGNEIGVGLYEYVFDDALIAGSYALRAEDADDVLSPLETPVVVTIVVPPPPPAEQNNYYSAGEPIERDVPNAPPLPVLVEGDGKVELGATALNFHVNVGPTNALYTYGAYLTLITAGLGESGRTIENDADSAKRFLGGNSVTSALALMAKTASAGSNLVYYSAVISLAKWRERYPHQEIVEFEFAMDTRGEAWNGQLAAKYNISHVESYGLSDRAYSSADGQDYAFSSSSTPDVAGRTDILVQQRANLENRVTPVRKTWLRITINLFTSAVTYKQLLGGTSEVTI